MKSGNKAITTAVDPICGMEVDESTALSGEKDGKTFYFCSPGCREEFLGPEIPPEEPSTSAKASADKESRIQNPEEVVV